MYLYFFNLIVCVVRYQDSGMGHSGVEMGYTEVYSTLQCFPHCTQGLSLHPGFSSQSPAVPFLFFIIVVIIIVVIVIIIISVNLSQSSSAAENFKGKLDSTSLQSVYF